MAAAELEPRFDPEQGYRDVLDSFRLAAEGAAAAGAFVESPEGRVFVGYVAAVGSLSRIDKADILQIRIHQTNGVEDGKYYTAYEYGIHAYDEDHSLLLAEPSDVYYTSFRPEDLDGVTERETERLCVILANARFSYWEAALRFDEIVRPGAPELSADDEVLGDVTDQEAEARRTGRRERFMAFWKRLWYRRQTGN